jgi:glyoxylase-like metal-dependent hydrolase (beta-lactamase superfamily II)
LDHTLNLARLQQEHGAWIAAPPADGAHIQGTYPYRGAARVCGALESAGRRLLRYRACKPDRWFGQEDEFPWLGGLRPVPLPGHTAGHTGFHVPSRKLLFTGDLFADFWLHPQLPPGFLNTSQVDLHRSVARVLSMDLEGILPNHGWAGSPASHLARFRRLAGRLRLTGPG